MHALKIWRQVTVATACRTVLASVFPILLFACDSTSSPSSPTSGELSFTEVAEATARPDVPAVEMPAPAQARSWDRDDASLVAETDRAGGLVTVAFKEPTSSRVLDTGVRAAVSGRTIDLGVKTVSEMGAEVIWDLGLMGAVGARMDPALAPVVRRLDIVDYVEPHQRFESAGPTGSIGAVPSTRVPMPLDDLPWGVEVIKADEVWSTTSGYGARVLVIDTSHQQGHEDLPFVATGHCGGNPNGCGGPSSPAHATHVLGIITAPLNFKGVMGVARGISANDVFVWGWSNAGDIQAGILQGITWDVDVINMSIQGGDNDQGVYNAVLQAWNHGIVLVAAAGNVPPALPGTVSYPANFANVIGVSGFKPNGEFAERFDNDLPDSCEFQNRGSNHGLHVDISAPFYAVSTVPDDDYEEMCGTSMAAPHVAGTVALMRAKNPSIPNWQIVQILFQTAGDAGPSGYDAHYGYGLLNAKAAVDATPYPPPPFTVSIGGESTVNPAASCTWTANPSNGTAPYSYQWSGVLSGSGSQVSGQVSSSGWLYVTVTDSSNPPKQANGQKHITADWNAPPFC